MKRVRRRVAQHLSGSWWVYLIVMFFFLAGALFGFLGVKALDEQQLTSLVDFLDQEFSRLTDLDLAVTTKQAFYNNIYNLGKIGLFGLAIIGIPFILVILFTRGFVLGFTVVFLLKEKGFQGAMVAFLALLPPNLLSLPAYIMAAVTAINFSVYLIRGRQGQGAAGISQHLIGYFLVMLLSSLLLAASSFLEGYFCPVMIRIFG